MSTSTRSIIRIRIRNEGLTGCSVYGRVYTKGTPKERHPTNASSTADQHSNISNMQAAAPPPPKQLVGICQAATALQVQASEQASKQASKQAHKARRTCPHSPSSDIRALAVPLLSLPRPAPPLLVPARLGGVANRPAATTALPAFLKEATDFGETGRAAASGAGLG